MRRLIKKNLHSHNYQFVGILLIIVLCLFSPRIKAQDLVVVVDDLSANLDDSSMLVSMYLEDVTDTIGSFQFTFSIDAEHIIVFDTLDYFNQAGSIIADWSVGTSGISTQRIISLFGAPQPPSQDYILPFAGRQLLLQFNVKLASDDPALLCDSSGVFFLNASSPGFLKPGGQLLEAEYEPAEYSVDCLSCGDANGDAVVSVSDAVYIINFVFAGGADPLDHRGGDVNCDGDCNISDAVWIVNWIFVGGHLPCDVDGDSVPDC